MDIPFLKIKNIIKKFGSRTVLNDISLDIYKGEIISLLGVNGAGKTTLSSIIATLFPPTTGDIEFEGKSIYSDIVSYRFNIGFCQQKPNLTTALTLEQNLRLAGSYYNMPQNLIERRLGELAEQFDLHPYLKEDASILSGGFRQRFMIARSLMHNPKLLLLDEPTFALDSNIRL